MGILTESAQGTEKVKLLLNKELPSYRQAYSDRTAWLMACLSELAYVKFNPLMKDAKHKDYILDAVKKMVDKKRLAGLVGLINALGYDHEKNLLSLKAELEHVRLRLIDTFDCEGTQAILVGGEKFVALAFRGTEAESIRDIKADCNALTVACESGGKIHSGFNEAYNCVASEIQNALDRDEHKDLPLFITGHSLGGALATIAAKKLSHKGGIAACYTFGAPRVGDEHWTERKTPVYRIVNSADCVTMLPPGDELVSVIGWVVKRLSSSASSWLVDNCGGYYHGGDMRYLTNCKQGKYGGVKMLYAVSFVRRIRGWLAKGAPWKSFLADHSISVYRKKLRVIAERRNQPAASSARK
ncbi:MAG: lipase family protein [Gammaproteobacteria bacterium]